MYEGQIPFDQHGNPLPYVPRYQADRVVWEANAPFRAVLEFQRFERGRSAAHAIYAKADDPSWEATMFLTDFQDVVKRALIPLRLNGRFIFTKRGTNYGIKLLLIDG